MTDQYLAKRWGYVASSAIFLIFASEFYVFLEGVFPKPYLLSFVKLSLHLGVGSILIREAAARWKKGLVCVFILAVAYSLVLEGLVLQNIFNPRNASSVEIGIVNFGRWGNINVVWSLGIILVHSVFNIVIPIVITDSLFPNTSGQMSNMTLMGLIFAFLADTCYIIWVPDYHPDPHALIVILVLIFLLIGAAWSVPPLTLRASALLPNEWVLFLGGFLGYILFVGIFHYFHKFVADPVWNLVGLVGLVALSALILLRLPDLSRRLKAALAAGIYYWPIGNALFHGRYIVGSIGVVVLTAVCFKSRFDNDGAS